MKTTRNDEPLVPAAARTPASAAEEAGHSSVSDPHTCSPARIMECGFGFWASKVLLTAVQLGLFTALSGRSMTADEVGDALSLHPRGRYDFLDCLLSMGFLKREGDGPGGRYSNTAETARFSKTGRSIF